MEHSAAAKECRSADRLTLRAGSKHQVDTDRIVSNSSKSPERRVISDARTRDDNCTETECERLNKYPDYCRTITIRG